MSQLLPFAEVVEAADNLSHEEQAALVEILSRRLAERGRQQLAAEVQEARKEFQEGGCKAMSADDLMNEILS